MSRYDENWERLLRAVFRREHDREVACLDSASTSFSSVSESSDFDELSLSFRRDEEQLVEIAPRNSTIDSSNSSSSLTSGGGLTFVFSDHPIHQRQERGPSSFQGSGNARRLLRELRDLRKDPPPTLSAGPVANDLSCWQATIVGPVDSPFANGVFLLKIHIPKEYPIVAPKIDFITKVFHPNINRNGKICPAMFELRNWCPALSISKALLMVNALLADPVVDDPLVPEIAHMYMTNKNKYEATARSWTQKYAMGY